MKSLNSGSFVPLSGTMLLITKFLFLNINKTPNLTSQINSYLEEMREIGTLSVKERNLSNSVI